MGVGESRPNTDDKSFEAGSVHTDCSELNVLFSNLSTTNFTSTTDSSIDGRFSNVAGNIDAEFLDKFEEPSKHIAPTQSTIRIAETRNVVMVKRRNKPPDYDKKGYRQVPNPWRRFGSLKTLHDVGGWSTPRGKDKRLYFVKAGTPLPVEPKCHHLSLHRDPNILTSEFFKFKINRSDDSQMASHLVATKIAENCMNLRRSS